MRNDILHPFWPHTHPTYQVFFPSSTWAKVFDLKLEGERLGNGDDWWYSACPGLADWDREAGIEIASNSKKAEKEH